MREGQQARRRLGFAGLVVVLAGCGAMCREGREVPGDPTRFDPVARYDEMAEHAGSDLELTRLTAEGVREDGTVNLEAESYDATVSYHFVRSVPPPDDAPPVGAGGAEQWHQTVDVRLRRAGFAGMVTESDGTRRQVRTKGMVRDEHEPEPGPASEQGGVPAPRCGFAELWKRAKQQGAPSGAVADISYLGYRTEGKYQGASKYQFRIDDTFRQGFDPDCEPVEIDNWVP